MASTPQTRLAQAIRDMRQERGWSHDDLVAYLKQHTQGKPTRPLAIQWEKRSVPGPKYRDALIQLGVPENLWPAAPPRVTDAETLEMMREALGNQRQQRDDLQALSGAVKRLSADLKRALEILEELRMQNQSQRPPRQQSR